MKSSGNYDRRAMDDPSMTDRAKLKSEAWSAIDAKRAQIVGMGEAIMDAPELGFKEWHTAAPVCGLGKPSQTDSDFNSRHAFEPSRQPSFCQHTTRLSVRFSRHLTRLQQITFC